MEQRRGLVAPQSLQQNEGWARMPASCRSYNRIVREELLLFHLKGNTKVQFLTPQFSKRRQRRKRKQKSPRKLKANPCVRCACYPFLKPLRHSTSCERPPGHLTCVDSVCYRQKWHKTVITGVVMERKKIWCRTSSLQSCASSYNHHVF